MWLRAGSIVALSVAAAVLAAPIAASAEDPVDLQGAYLLDTVGAVSGDEARVQAAIDDLYSRAHIQLFVVYVDSFTGAADDDWANQVATSNGLGQSDILLAIATEDRNYQVSVDNNFSLTDDQLTEVDNDFLIPQLRDDHWADAAIDAAQGYAQAATGVVGPNPPTGSNPDPAPAGGLSPAVPIVGGVLVVGAGAFIFAAVRRRKRDAAKPTVPDQLTQKELDRRAGSLLVQLDDSLKTSEQELGFAVAQFGDAATKDFTAVLASAKTKVAQAFTLKQQLDDTQRDSDEDRRAWTTQIIQLCEAADAELDAQADAFDELRQLEKNAPDALVAVRTSIADTTTRQDAAKTALKALSDRYSAAAVRAVAGNIDQSAKLLQFANGSAEAAGKSITAGKPADAAISVRSSQQAVGQAGQLFDAIDKLGHDLDEASGKLDAAIADTTQDVAAAKALKPDAGLASAIAAAESALASAGKSTADPLASLAEVGKANAALEQVFTGVRDTQEQVDRAVGQLDSATAAARAQIASATEYITTRRGGIGETARTRLSEADRHLAQAQALATSDPVAALREAKQANDLASTAFQLAQADVDGYDGAGSLRNDIDNSSSGYYPDGSDGADLGGLLGGLFGGGGSSSKRGSSWGGSSWGGSSWGGGRSSSSWGSSSRSSRSGSFGGSSRSSFHSSGGRSGHGGRF